MAYKEINFRDVNENVVSLLADQWGLVTAGNETGYNTMTVSWGSVGELWFKDVATVYIRPQRYTKEWIDDSKYFSLSFYPADMKNALKICGSKSGRDTDKAAEAKLSAVFDEKAPYFEGAKLVLICKKMAVQQFDPAGFIDLKIMDTYSAGDFHYIYYGEIEKVLILEK